MILLESNTGSHCVILFGLGLIGQSVKRSLVRRGYRQTLERRFSWQTDSHWQEMELNGIRALLLEKKVRGKRLHVAWTAGAAGFSASYDDVTAELTSFQSVLNFAKMLTEIRAANAVHLHVMSSAGGLFEGQRLINNSSTPAPIRPYGHLKQQQETLAAACRDIICVHIYRPTSVYSPVNLRFRNGLIPTLIRNCILNRESTIIGHYSTLRDFVWIDDIGRFVAECILSPGYNLQDQTHLLASGTPMTILRVVQIIEQTLMRRVPMKFCPEATNSADMTVAACSLPARLHVTDVSTTVRNICVKLICSGLRS